MQKLSMKQKTYFHLRIISTNNFELNGLYLQEYSLVTYYALIQLKYIRNTNAFMLDEKVSNLLS